MDSIPRVSVIMPAYNASTFVLAAKDSILAQTFSSNGKKRTLEYAGKCAKAILKAQTAAETKDGKALKQTSFCS